MPVHGDPRGKRSPPHRSCEFCGGSSSGRTWCCTCRTPWRRKPARTGRAITSGWSHAICANTDLSASRTISMRRCRRAWKCSSCLRSPSAGIRRRRWSTSHFSLALVWQVFSYGRRCGFPVAGAGARTPGFCQSGGGNRRHQRLQRCGGGGDRLHSLLPAADLGRRSHLAAGRSDRARRGIRLRCKVYRLAGRVLRRGLRASQRPQGRGCRLPAVRPSRLRPGS